MAFTRAIIGLGAAYLVGCAMQSTLYGVGAMDASAFGAVAAIFLVAALLACLFPAWWASRVSPSKHYGMSEDISDFRLQIF